MILTASYRSSSYRSHIDARGRVAALVLALLAGLLVVLALITIGAITGQPIFESRPLATFQVAPNSGGEQAEKKPAQRKPRVAQRRKQAHAAPPPRAAAVPPPPITLPGVITLSRADFARSDIGRIRSKRDDTARADGEDGAKSGAESAQTAGVGEGPGGATLYNAQWYREPTHAEIAPFMRGATRSGWGMVICRTVERFHVEDCREVAESPGSGIARALRQASWQFLVRPPRIDGKPLIGAWVRIKFDLIEKKDGAEDGK